MQGEELDCGTDEAGMMRVEEDDSESTLSRQAKMESSRRQGVLSQVHQAVKVNITLGTNFEDPLQKGDISRVEDGKTLKKGIDKLKLNIYFIYCAKKYILHYAYQPYGVSSTNTADRRRVESRTPGDRRLPSSSIQPPSTFVHHATCYVRSSS